jgi:hypothetical protein
MVRDVQVLANGRQDSHFDGAAVIRFSNQWWA